MADCPSRDELIALLAGSDAGEGVRAHLDSCPSCRDWVAKLHGALRVGAISAAERYWDDFATEPSQALIDRMLSAIPQFQSVAERRLRSLVVMFTDLFGTGHLSLFTLSLYRRPNKHVAQVIE